MSFKKKNITLFIVFFAVIIMGLSVNSEAAGNIHYGGTELHPAISLAYRYDDNVYLTDVNESDDSIYIISPSIEVKRSHDERVYSLEYSADIYRYASETKEDKETHTGTAFINTRFPGGLKLMLRDSYVKTADPASSESTDMDERTQNLLQLALGSNIFDRLSFSLKYSNTLHDYEEETNKAYLEAYDRKEELYGGEFTLRLLPKTSFFLEYSRGNIEYDKVIAADIRDSQSDYVSLGVKGQLTSKSSLNLSVGYTNRDYEATDREDVNTVIAALGFNYQYSSYTRILLTGKRHITESFFSSGTDRYYYYTDNTISLGLPLRISTKISSIFNVSYGINEYHKAASGGERTDYLYGAGLNINYNIRPWLYVGAGYHYRERNSDIDAEDYQNNQYTANVTVEF